MFKLARSLALLAGLCAAAATAFAAPREEFDVGTLHVERYGDAGSAVVLIPGLAGGSWVWKDTIARLQGEHRVYAVTLAGFDGRPRVEGDVIALAEESLQQLVESRHLAKPVLVGHSLGGTLALMFAAAHSELISGVFAVDGLPVFPGSENMPAEQRPAMAARLRAQFDVPQPEFEAQQLKYMQRIGVVADDAAVAAARLQSRSDPKATADYGARLFALDLRPQMSAIRVPVTEVSPYLASDFAARGIDEAGKTAYYRALLGGIEKLDVVSIAPSRHFVMIDQPAAFMQALERFLQQVAKP